LRIATADPGDMFRLRGWGSQRRLETIVEDQPVRFGDYAPADFDRVFRYWLCAGRSQAAMITTTLSIGVKPTARKSG
jgi:hypothetical protein